MYKGLLALSLFALNVFFSFHISQRVYAADPAEVLTFTVWLSLLPVAAAGLLWLAARQRAATHVTRILGFILCAFIALALVRANVNISASDNVAASPWRGAVVPVQSLASMPVSRHAVPTPEDAVRQYRPFLPRMLTASLRMDELAVTPGGRLAAYFSVVDKAAGELDVPGLLNRTRPLLVGRLCSIIPVKQYVLDQGFTARALVRDRRGAVLIEQNVRREDCEVRTLPAGAMDIGAEGRLGIEAAGTN